MHGLAIKLWSSEFDKDSDEFRTLDSVVYLSHDIGHTDIVYIGSVISHLVGDASLEDVFRKHVPVVKGEPIFWDVEPPSVKEENPDYDSGNNEDHKEHYFDHNMEDECKEAGSIPQLKTKKWKKDDSDSDDINDADFGSKPKRARKARSGTQSSLSRPGTCDACSRECATQGALVSHLKICNPEQLKQLPEKTRRRKPEGTKREYQEYSCSYCARKFSFKKACEKHELLHISDPDSKKLKESSWRENTKSRRDPNTPAMPNGQYQCDKCQAVFTMYSALSRHAEAHLLSESVVSHDGEEKSGLRLQEMKDGSIMKCTICDVAYTTFGMYQAHMKKYHNKGLGCNDCGKRFTLPNALKNHIINHHTTFPKKCNECGHFCASKEEFKEHMANTHGDGVQEKTNPCETCGKMFKSKYSLKAHVKLMHSESEEFPCDQCGKVFRAKASLEYHTKVHNGDYPYRCDECGNGFMRHDHMLDCKNAHAGIFKFQCPQCDYKTNKERQYKRHMTVHTNEKPFTCPICGHSSSTVGNLSSHVRKVHKLTLVKSEILACRNRHGHTMSEEELAEAKRKLELTEKARDTIKMKPEGAGNVPNNTNRTTAKNSAVIKARSEEDGPSQNPPARLLFPYL